jgi:hypothetical protein
MRLGCRIDQSFGGFPGRTAKSTVEAPPPPDSGAYNLKKRAAHLRASAFYCDRNA